MTGMDLIRSIKEGVQQPPPGIVTLGLDGGDRWLEHFEPGLARMAWEVDPAYFNLEDAVICSWLACLADQAIFYATNTLLGDGEVTRVINLGLSYGEPLREGRVSIEARVVSRTGNLLISECRFEGAAGTAVLATATSRIVNAG